MFTPGRDSQCKIGALRHSYGQRSPTSLQCLSVGRNHIENFFFQLFVTRHGLACYFNVSFLLSFFCHLHSHIFLVNDDIIDVQGDVVAGLRHLHFCSSIFFIWLFQQPTFSLISTWPAMVKLSSTMKGMRWTCWWTLWHSCTWKGNTDLVELGMDVCWKPNVDVPDFLCYLKEWWMTRVEGVVTAFQWGQKCPQKFLPEA